MARDDLAQTEGVVTDVKAGGHFVVQLDSGQEISAKLSGRMRKFHIRVILGDRVTVGVSPYDPRETAAPRPGSTPQVIPPKLRLSSSDPVRSKTPVRRGFSA